MRLAALASRGLSARPVRTALTVLGVALGVALVTGTLIANEAAAASVRRAATELYGRADLRIRSFNEGGFSPQAIIALRGIPGVMGAAAVGERRLTISTAPGPNEQVFTLLVLGVDPADEVLVRAHDLSSGIYLSSRSPGDALVNAIWATEHGLAVGDQLLLVGATADAPPMRIVGLLQDVGFGALANGNVMVMNRSALDTAFAVSAPVTAVDLVVESGRLSDVQDGLDARMSEPFVVETVADVERQLAEAQAGFAGIAFLFALVALAVGAFLVGNTQLMTVGERTREIGLLRAAGTTRRQVLGIFLRQAVILGFIGSVAGVALGIGLSVLMIGFLQSTRVILVSGLPLNPGSLAFAFGVGFAITLAAAGIPAMGAARVSPLDALRPSRQPSRSLWSRLPLLLALAVIAVVVGLFAYPLERGQVQAPVALVMLGVLLAGLLLTAGLVQPLSSLIGRPFEWFFGAEGRLGRANLGRNRARTGLTVSALVLALASVVTLGVVAESARAAAERWVVSIIPGGYAVRMSLPLDIATTQPDLETTGGAAAATPIVEFSLVSHHSTSQAEMPLAGIDPTVYEDAGALVFVEGRRGDAFQRLRDGGAIIVPLAVATRDHLQVGSVLQLGPPGGTSTPFTVAGVIAYSLPSRSADGASLISLADADKVFGMHQASLWAFVPQAGMTAAGFHAAVADTAQRYAAELLTSSTLAGGVERSLDRLTGLFDALALLAVAIAGLGLINTLGVGVAERAREIAILRSHGMTTGQVQAMVAAEAAIMGAVAGISAIGIGLLAAWAITSGTAISDGGTAFAVPGPLVLSVGLLSIGVAALASFYPARVAAATSTVRSLQHFE